MNYLEALRSGKRYRPKDSPDTIWRLSVMEAETCMRSETAIKFLGEWETESEQITVTREQVEKAWDASGMHNYRCCGAEFLKALGFK